MIRGGALAIGMALAATWSAWAAPGHVPLQIVALAFLILGLGLLIAAREPWPHCCEHCPVYAGRRAGALKADGTARFEAAAIVAAARAERPAPAAPRTRRRAHRA